MQALATGIPAIGFRLDGTPEVVIDGKTGYTVTPEKVDDVIAVTKTILDDPALRSEMGRNGKQLVLERFDWKRMADILEKEYFTLLQKSVSAQ